MLRRISCGERAGRSSSSCKKCDRGRLKSGDGSHRDTLHILRVMYVRFHAPGAPGSPELVVERQHVDVVTSFMELRRRLAHEGERAARVESLTRAAEFVLGPDAHTWLHRELSWPDGPLRPPSLQRAGRVADSDEELSACLAALEVIRATAAIGQHA